MPEGLIMSAQKNFLRIALDEVLTKEVYQPADHNSFKRFLAAFCGAFLSELIICPLLFRFIFGAHIHYDWLQLISVSAQRFQINLLLGATILCAISFFSVGVGIIVSFSTRSGASLFCLFKRGIRVTITISMIAATLLVLLTILDDVISPSRSVGELIR